MQILYNTSMGVAAGLAMLLLVAFWKKVLANQPTPTPVPAAGGPAAPPPAASSDDSSGFDPAAWGPAFVVLGVILTLLGGAMTLTWPLFVNPPINIVFGEPCLWFGVLLLAAGVWLWCGGGLNREGLRAVSLVAAAIGLVLAWCAAAIVRFTLVGSAPAAEPITGLLHDYPVVENTFFALLYAFSAAGALVFPKVVRGSYLGWAVMRVSWTTAGWGFLLFSAMNFYTHVGLLINNARPGPDIPF